MIESLVVNRKSLLAKFEVPFEDENFAGNKKIMCREGSLHMMRNKKVFQNVTDIIVFEV